MTFAVGMPVTFRCGNEKMRAWYHLRARFAGRHSTSAAGLLVFAMLIGASDTAHAGCMTAPTAALRELADLSARNPAELLATKMAPTADLVNLGWQRAAQAEAYDTLSRPADARRTALGMLDGKLASNSPVYIELLTRYAINGFHPEQIDKAFIQVQAARRHVAPGSPADACLQIALGEMQRMRGLPERAVVYLADAYRATSIPSMKRQHVLAGEKLARVIDGAGDHQQAISLIEEVMASDSAQGRTVALSNDFYFRGGFNLGRGAYRAALADFEHSRALAPAGVDPAGAAFLDLQTCATLIQLHALERAKAMCLRADRTFTSHGEMAGAQAQLYLARIAFAQNEPEKALAGLDRLLASKDGLASFASVPEAFRLRSDVNRRLGRSQRAFEDLGEYVRLSDEQRSSEQARQSAILRARFDTDRAAARNEELQQRLRFADAREREQSKRYVILGLSATGGVLLVMIMAVMGTYHRRKLVTLANTDPLTGLMNRRFVSENEKNLIDTHVRTGASLTVAIVDIDHFKAVNDNHGHDAGDEVLIAFAATIRSVVRKCDVIARWGGEEFIVIFPNATQEQAIDVLRRIRTALENPVMTAAGPIRVRFSAGVASFAGIGNLHALAQQADEALYRAKASGRDRIEAAGPQDSRGADGDGASSAMRPVLALA
jgi:diguanylate cyclase (GGDEF)-like protein